MNIRIVSYETKVHFQLKKMEEIYVNQKGVPDDPHRHNYYTIIWPTISAKGNHIIDFHEYPIKKDMIFFIQPGQIHQLIAHEKPAGYVINFSPEFLNKAKIEKSFIDNLKVYNSFLYNEPLFVDSKKASKLKSFINSISISEKSTNQYRDEAIGAYLRLFLIECTSVCDAEIEKDKNKSKIIIDEFKRLVEKYFFREHQVNFYSDRLVISPGHLNHTIKSELGITAKKYIQNRITLEAKRLILFSNENAKEISYQLGFRDPHHFSKFIKNQTGITISNLTEKYKKSTF